MPKIAATLHWLERDSHTGHRIPSTSYKSQSTSPYHNQRSHEISALIFSQPSSHVATTSSPSRGITRNLGQLPSVAPPRSPTRGGNLRLPSVKAIPAPQLPMAVLSWDIPTPDLFQQIIRILQQGMPWVKNKLLMLLLGLWCCLLSINCIPCYSCLWPINHLYSSYQRTVVDQLTIIIRESIDHHWSTIRSSIVYSMKIQVP